MPTQSLSPSPFHGALKSFLKMLPPPQKNPSFLKVILATKAEVEVKVSEVVAALCGRILAAKVEVKVKVSEVAGCYYCVYRHS